MCGEHLPTYITDLSRGSSPRVWGTPTAAAARRSASPAVHPHVCGEHSVAIAYKIGYIRFIPTCVGNTIWAVPAVSRASVHPHVCGEHTGLPLRYAGDRPVHPHVCGEHVSWQTVPMQRSRFIPTCVGNTILIRNLRICPSRFIPTCVGNTFAMGHVVVEYRFIPTCVGNTSVQAAGSARMPVHPHVCGEHSPVSYLEHAHFRFIPTCVGNTDEQSSGPVRSTGSSPRVWGTH